MKLIDLFLVAALVAFTVAGAMVAVPLGVGVFGAGCVGVWYLAGEA